MQDNFWSESKNLFEEFKKKAKIKDLKYTAQISETQDDEKPVYALQFTNVADNLAPVTFIDKKPDGVINKVQSFLENMDYDAVEIKYHEAQAYHAQETAKRHLKMIETIQERIKKESKKEEK